MRQAGNIGAATRFKEVCETQADDNGQRGNSKEITQRLDAHAAKRLVIATTSDAQNHATEDNRYNHHLHHLDKDVTEGLEDLRADPRLILRMDIEIPTDEHAKQQPGNDLPHQGNTFHV
ncbi:hypothetical protein D3C81_1134730 [compost metagenome]